MIYLFLSFNFWELIGSLNMWLLVYLKQKKSTSQALTKKLTKLFDQYGTKRKIIAYVKDEGSNLKIMIIHL